MLKEEPMVELGMLKEEYIVGIFLGVGRFRIIPQIFLFFSHKYMNFYILGILKSIYPP
jgi:hypothetical protein